MLRLEDVIKRLEQTEHDLRDVRSRLSSEPRPYDLQRGLKPNKFQVPIAPRTPSTGIADGEVWYDDTVNAYRGQASTQQFHFMSSLRAGSVPVFAGTHMAVNLYAGAGVTLTPSGNAIRISATASGGAPVDAEYIVAQVSAGLTAQRVAKPGSLMFLLDGPITSEFIFNSFDDYFVGGTRVGTALGLDLRGKGYASLSGSYSAPRVIATVFVPSMAGADGAPGAAPDNAQYVVIATSATLSQERAIAAGSFMGLVDGGAGNNLQLNAYPWTNYLVGASSVATAAAEDWYGRGYASLAGSYNPATGRAAMAVFVPSMAGGGTGDGAPGAAPDNAQYVVLAASATLSQERALIASTLIQIIDEGAGGNLRLSSFDEYWASGTRISTAIGLDVRGTGYASISGSYSAPKVILGVFVPSMVGGAGDGAPGAAPDNAQYVVMAASATLSAERALKSGSLIEISDQTTFVNVNAMADYLVAGSRITGSALALDLRATGYGSLTGSLSDRQVIANIHVASQVGGPLQSIAGSLLLAQHAFTHAHSDLSGILPMQHHSPMDWYAAGAFVSTAWTADWQGTGYASLAGSYNSTLNRLVYSTFVPSMAGPDGAPGAAPDNAQYVVLSVSATLSQERAAVAGSLIQLVDGGAGSNLTLNSFDDYLVGGTRVGTALALDVRGTGYASLSGSYSAPKVILSVFVPSMAGGGLSGTFGDNWLAQGTLVATALTADMRGGGYASLSGSYNAALDEVVYSSHVSTGLVMGTGLPGGQIVYGGVAASENLTLDSTAHATKGAVILASKLRMAAAANNVIQDEGGTARITIATASPFLTFGSGTNNTGDTLIKGRVALGGSTPALATGVALNILGTAGLGAAGALVQQGLTTAVPAADTWGVGGLVHSASTTATDLIVGLNFQAWYTAAAAGALTALEGIHVMIAPRGAGTISYGRGIHIATPYSSTAKKNPDDMGGIDIADQYALGSNTPALVYGIRIADISGGTLRYLLEIGAATPYLRLVGGAAPAANMTNLYLAEGVTPTLRQVAWVDSGALGGAAIPANTKLMYLV